MVAETLLFDLDGTLTDPREGIERSIRYAFETLGQTLDSGQDLGWCVGPPLLGSLERLLGSGREALAEETLRAYRRRFEDVGIFENKVYPDIPEVLEALSGRAKLLVCTSKPLPFAERILDHFDLRRRFNGVYGSSLDGLRTNKAELIAWILGERALDPSQTLMIGDREHDVLGAQANSVGTVGVLWGYGSSEELEAAGVQRLARTPGELLELI